VVHTDLISAGAVYYGISDLQMLWQEAPEFRKAYFEDLVGKFPMDRHLYLERSPKAHFEKLRTPLLIFQGAEDSIVTPSQSQVVRDACIKNGIKHKYFEFEGESHGFRKSQTITTCAIEELKFFGEVLGFVPAD
jgi:dipeptidyl aminopeptidase/acylaminoacyl peptidase